MPIRPIYDVHKTHLYPTLCSRNFHTGFCTRNTVTPGDRTAWSRKRFITVFNTKRSASWKLLLKGRKGWPCLSQTRWAAHWERVIQRMRECKLWAWGVERLKVSTGNPLLECVWRINMQWFLFMALNILLTTTNISTNDNTSHLNPQPFITLPYITSWAITLSHPVVAIPGSPTAFLTGHQISTPRGARARHLQSRNHGWFRWIGPGRAGIPVVNHWNHLKQIFKPWKVPCFNFLSVVRISCAAVATSRSATGHVGRSRCRRMDTWPESASRHYVASWHRRWLTGS